MAFYLYSETAFHHEGDYDFMIELIDTTAEIGAKGIKFQVLLNLTNLFSSKHSLYEKLTSCIFTYDQWKSIFHHCKKRGLDIIFMPCGVDSFKLIEDPEIEIDYIDIHSVSFYDFAVLDLVKKTGLPIILGIGGRTPTEIDDKLDFFGEQLKVLMVGFQSFPTLLKDVKLEKIRFLKEKYSNLEIGYADHSSFTSHNAILSNDYAYILGATYFEKHLTTREGEERLDYYSAISKERLKKVIDRLENLDTNIFKFSEDRLALVEDKELAYRNRQKTVVAGRDLKKGEPLTEENLYFQMIDKPNGEVDKNIFLGKIVTENIEKFDIITKAQIQ